MALPKVDPRIQAILDSAYSDFHSHHYQLQDPVSLAHAYADARDREVAAFFAAILAYGNVRTILASVNKILLRLGASPYQSLVDLKFANLFSDFRHRFTTGEDIEILCHWLSQALRSHGSIEAFFVETVSMEFPEMKTSLSNFVNRLTRLPLPAAFKSVAQRRGRNLKYLISDPGRGSACKRLNMYLRWVVRPADGIDLGLWTKLRASQLMLPVDTHLLQTLQQLRWTRSKQATWQVVESATARLRIYSPEDPVRYDFALCHLSMAGKSIRTYLKPEQL